MDDLTPDEELKALTEYMKVEDDPLMMLSMAIQRVISECHIESHKPVKARDYDHAFQYIVRALNAIQVWMIQQERAKREGEFRGEPEP